MLIPIFTTVRKSINKLTKTEYDFICREDYPKIKHAVIQKLCQRFDHLGELLVENLSVKVTSLHVADGNVNYKTTRGENYKLMPYVVVDYPKIKGKDFKLCCRTMFWWGNYFSMNIIIRTNDFDMKYLCNYLFKLKNEKLLILTGDDLWQQDLNDVSFIKTDTLSKARLLSLISKNSYMKLSMKVYFDKADSLEKTASEFYKEILNGLKINIMN